MRAIDLIHELRSKGYSIEIDGGHVEISPADGISQEMVRELRVLKEEIIKILEDENADDMRRKQVMQYLDEHPSEKRCVLANKEERHGVVVFTVGLRNIGTFKLMVPISSMGDSKIVTLLEGVGNVH